MTSLPSRKQIYMEGGYMQSKITDIIGEDVLDLISELGKLTDEELELLVNASSGGIVGVA